MEQEKQTPSGEQMGAMPPITSEPGDPTRPIHIVSHTWSEKTRQDGDYIRDNLAFEDKWASYSDGLKIIIPEEMRKLFANGGVVTCSPEDHLLLFGGNHWNYYQRLLAKQVGTSPINNEMARHIYENMHRFSRLNDDGSITITREQASYAGIESDVVIVGVVYHAEIHAKDAYVISQKTDALLARKDRFRKFFNK